MKHLKSFEKYPLSRSVPFVEKFYPYLYDAPVWFIRYVKKLVLPIQEDLSKMKKLGEEENFSELREYALKWMIYLKEEGTENYKEFGTFHNSIDQLKQKLGNLAIICTRPNAEYTYIKTGEIINWTKSFSETEYCLSKILEFDEKMSAPIN